MPDLREDLRQVAAAEIEAEAAKVQDERGLGVSILYIRDRGAIVAYRITANTNVEGGRVGTTVTYPDVAATREPTDAEVMVIVQAYGVELIDDIKVRRSELRDIKVRRSELRG